MIQDRCVHNRFFELLKSPRPWPLVIAHRGDSFHAPENTLEAARLGWKAGADAWELDVQLTRDGVAVVFHDEFLTRTTDVRHRFPNDRRGKDDFRVSDFDWNEIHELDAGSWFVEDCGVPNLATALGMLEKLSGADRESYRSGRVRVPALREALALTAELDWLVNIEIKSVPESPPGLVEAVLQAIGETDTASRVLISSFDHRSVARMPGLIAPDRVDLRAIPRGILVSYPLYRPQAYLTEIVGAQTFHASAQSLGAGSVGYRRQPSPATLWSDEVAALKAAGIPILVYTVNDHRPGGLAEHLAEIEVDALFTDDPAAMKARFT
jgi:glycerophosphoryl diester phosphodiesterase